MSNEHHHIASLRVRANAGMTLQQERAYMAGQAHQAALRCQRLYHSQESWDERVAQTLATWMKEMRAAIAEYERARAFLP